MGVLVGKERGEGEGVEEGGGKGAGTGGSSALWSAKERAEKVAGLEEMEALAGDLKGGSGQMGKSAVARPSEDAMDTS